MGHGFLRRLAQDLREGGAGALSPLDRAVLESRQACVRNQHQDLAMAAITALQLINRILEKSGAANRPQTIDHVSAGDPTTAVTGIATMAIASLDSLKQAAAAGRNLILTYDPAFWSGNDSFDRLEDNSLFLEKRDFIR